MTEERFRICERCYFFYTSPHAIVRECHKKSPPWPPVEEDSWCGEWKRKVPPMTDEEIKEAERNLFRVAVESDPKLLNHLVGDTPVCRHGTPLVSPCVHCKLGKDVP